jgi:hypothetical protein
VAVDKSRNAGDPGTATASRSRWRVVTFLVAVLILAGLLTGFGLGYPGDLACQWQEGREGSRYTNLPARLEALRSWAADQGLTVVVVGSDPIEDSAAGTTAAQHRVGDVTSASACRPAGVRKSADIYVRVAVAR